MKRIPEPEWMDDPEEARAYAQADFNEVNEAFVARLLAFETREERLRVLDLGCGPGDMVWRAALTRPQWRLTGLDASRAMLRHAATDARVQTVHHPAAWVISDAKRTPFPKATFDLVFSNSILHHMGQPEDLWREVRRLAMPGARILFRDLMRPASEAAAQALVSRYAGNESKLLQEEFYRSFLSAFTLEEVREQLQGTGLEPLRVEAVSDRHLDVWGRLPE